MLVVSPHRSSRDDGLPAALESTGRCGRSPRRGPQPREVATCRTAAAHRAAVEVSSRLGCSDALVSGALSCWTAAWSRRELSANGHLVAILYAGLWFGRAGQHFVDNHLLRLIRPAQRAATVSVFLVVSPDQWCAAAGADDEASLAAEVAEMFGLGVATHTAIAPAPFVDLSEARLAGTVSERLLRAAQRAAVDGGGKAGHASGDEARDAARLHAPVQELGQGRRAPDERTMWSSRRGSTCSTWRMSRCCRCGQCCGVSLPPWCLRRGPSLARLTPRSPRRSGARHTLSPRPLSL